jgi:hypothetical protein
VRPYAPYDSYAIGALGCLHVAGFGMSAAALMARAEAVGMRLRLDGDRVRFTAPKDPPADLLADLRENREAVRLALAARAAPPAKAADAWGLTEGERAAALARLETPAMGPAPAPWTATPMPLRTPPRPAEHWSRMPYGSERGRAFAQARRQPGACPTCAGRRWWCEVGEPDAGRRCNTCHPPDHLKPEDLETITT